jgi:hypothetical protein
MLASRNKRSRNGHAADGTNGHAGGRLPVVPLKSSVDGGANGVAAAEALDSGRDAAGRFVKGNAGGTGNPFARRVARLRSALLDAVTEGDLQAVARRLVLQAKNGDVAAAKLLLLYTVGRPAESVEPDRLDAEE